MSARTDGERVDLYCEQAVPKTNVLTRALICPFLDLYPTYLPTGKVQFLQKA